MVAAAVLDGVAHDRSTWARGAFAQGVDQGEGGLALGQVVADVLADLVGVAVVVEDVVDELDTRCRGAMP